MVDEYIETENPGDGDSAYQINETLSEIHALLQLCDFVVDDFDGTTKVYYKGVSEISESINFIPYFKTGDYDFRYDGEMYFRLGFVADDWLFFERIYFKYDDTIVDRKWRSDREVIGGGNILEIADNESDQFVKEREHPIFFTSDNITIRFEGDDGTHDHVLTEDELNALHTLYEIDQLVSELGNIRYAWEKQNPKDRE